MGAKCFGSAAASLLEPAAGKQREEAFANIDDPVYKGT